VSSPFTRPGDARLRIFYLGTLYQDVNRPEYLFEALRSLKAMYGSVELPLELVFMGMVDGRYVALSRELGLNDVVRFVHYRPHRESIACLETADAALILVDPHPNADRHVPGKLFEYLGARKPVLALAPPDSEAARLIVENHAGVVLAPDDPSSISKVLKKWIDLKLAGKDLPAISDSSLAPYSRKNQAESLDTILRGL
jgi:glycosyltransferase involved in cell wall biosynthesis